MMYTKKIAAAIFAVLNSEVAATGKALRTRESDIIKMLNTCFEINQLGEYDKVYRGIDIGQFKIPKGFESLILPAKVVVDSADPDMVDLTDRAWMSPSSTRFKENTVITDELVGPETVKEWSDYDPIYDSFDLNGWEKFWNRLGQDVNKNQLARVSVSEVRTVKNLTDVIGNSMVDGKTNDRLFSLVPTPLKMNFYDEGIYAFEFNGTAVQHWVRGVFSTYVKTVSPENVKDD